LASGFLAFPITGGSCGAAAFGGFSTSDLGCSPRLSASAVSLAFPITCDFGDFGVHGD
jgi:hypothetical protein